jgi:hypothetical protein
MLQKALIQAKSPKTDKNQVIIAEKPIFTNFF